MASRISCESAERVSPPCKINDIICTDGKRRVLLLQRVACLNNTVMTRDEETAFILSLRLCSQIKDGIKASGNIAASLFRLILLCAVNSIWKKTTKKSSEAW